MKEFKIVNLPLSDFNPDFLNDSPQLQILTIENCSLTSINKNFVSSNLNITTISLKYNKIAVIEEGAFANLFKINKIFLDYNSLTSLPGINCLSLSAQYNLLESVHIHQTTQFFVLDCNFIKKLTCDETLSVRSFGASNNSLSSIPCVGKMTSAYQIYLDGNKLGKIKKTLFSNLTNVTSLSLTGNPKLKIGSKMLSSMKNLNKLKVDWLVNGYKTLKSDCPKLSMIFLTTKNWNCTKLTKIAEILNPQKIYLDFNNKTQDFANFKCQLKNSDVSKFTN